MATDHDPARECAIVLTAKTFSGSSADIINASAAIIRAAYAERDRRIREAVGEMEDASDHRKDCALWMTPTGECSCGYFAALARLKEAIK